MVFSDMSGIEAIQNLRYAARAMELAREVSGIDLAPSFLGWLDKAHSNKPEEGSGREIYIRHVKNGFVPAEN